MVDELKQCDLCRLPVELPDFVLKTSDGMRYFCCEGCKVIFKMLHEQATVASTEQKFK